MNDTAVEHAAREVSARDAALEIVHVLTPETELVDGTLVLPGEDEAVEYGDRTLERIEYAIPICVGRTLIAITG